MSATALATAPSAPLAVPYSQIPRRPVHWLHEGVVPFRHVTIVIGQGGTSKGIYTLDYAARMTRGDPMPGEAGPSYGGPMDVILILPEDDPYECVAGRLEGAGAVTDRVHNLTVFPDGELFTVPGDLGSISQAISEIEFSPDDDGNRTVPRLAADGKPHKVGMVILDPLLSLATENMNSRPKARAVMESLEHLAKAHHLAVLLTHHTNADGRAASSRALVETARNVVTLSRLPKAPDTSPVRVVTVSKTNIGVTGTALRYALAGALDKPSVVWACEAPPEDSASRYGDSGDETGQPAGPEPAGPEPAGNSCPGVPASKRYRVLHKSKLAGAAAWDTAFSVGDRATAESAMALAVQHAGTPLAWQQVPGVEWVRCGAVLTASDGRRHAYSVLDRQSALAGMPA